MRTLVIIDGENFLYGLRKLAGTEDKKAPRVDFVDYPFRKLLDEVLDGAAKSQIMYYGAKLRQYDQTPEIAEKSAKVVSLQAKLVSNLQRQGINFVKVGYLRARERDACPNCELQEWILLEKGVDVGIAVKMVIEADKKTEIVLISSDTDLLPAVRTAKEKGAKITYVGYENRLVLSLAGMAHKTRVITAPMVNKYLHPEAATTNKSNDNGSKQE